jgi:hypothetical protein
MLSRTKRAFPGFLFALSVGCATAAVPQVSGAAKNVQIRKSDPPSGYVEVAPISASHGGGCGGFGELGTYEGALAMLKNTAAELRADYVRLDVATEPYMAPGCRVNEYVLRGVAFRRGAAQPPAENAANSAVTRAGPNIFQALADLVGQRAVIHLKSGEVLAGTVAALTPPDDVQIVLLDQSARRLKTGEIDHLKLAASER